MAALFSDQWFVQGLGVLGLVFTVAAFQSRTRAQILWRQCVGSVFFMVHFLLLSAYTGAAMNLVVVSRNLVFSKEGRRIYWLYLFIAVAIALLFLSWQGWVSVYPAAGVICGVFAVWQRRPAVIRALMLAATLLWIPYAIITGSYPVLANQLMLAVALLTGMVRHDRSRAPSNLV